MYLKRLLSLTLLLSLLAPMTAAQAQDDDRQRRRAEITAGNAEARAQRAEQGRPDVMLDIPNLKIEQVKIEVEELDARLSLAARVANLVDLRAGADVSIARVNVEITGVEAEAYLHVYLDDVVTIVNRTLETLENNPEIIQMLGQTLQQTVGTVGDVAGQALGPGGAVSNLTGQLGQTVRDLSRPGGLLSQTVNTLGQTVTQTVSETGRLTESVLNSTGQLVSQKTLGSVTDLTNVVSETTNQAGQTVKRVRDQAGNLIEYTLDQAGNVSGAKVVQQATGR